ncbi:MAG TPA: hypothetical protein VJW77_17335 [Terriglobia bacterium]|nr:hypothetical protein [Terriglobia bacterium]
MTVSRLAAAKNTLIHYFEETSERVYTTIQLRQLLSENRATWELAQSTTIGAFLDYLVNETSMRRVKLFSKDYQPVIRYLWGEVAPYKVALSLRPRSFLSHGSALALHGLTDQIPKTVYVNREQSEKNIGGKLSQAAIDRTFARQQRKSKYIYEYEGWRIVLLSGKFTGRLGVAKMKGPDGENLEVTDLERTLIDVAVRPAYAGGVFAVLDAFRMARQYVSSERLLRYLRKMAYVYPYHQVLGFYMQRAGYKTRDYAGLKKAGLSFDFYLAHGLAEKEYDSDWRLFHPKGF